jgi:hypothetical protein
MNRSSLFECQNGADRRAWLRTLGWQVRPTLRRLRRRAVQALAFVGKWVGIGALIAAGAVLMLALIAEAFRNDPLTTTPTGKPVSAPAVQPLRRMT